LITLYNTLIIWLVLASPQTGSGKTYTMGTGFDMAVLPEEQGGLALLCFPVQVLLYIAYSVQ